MRPKRPGLCPHIYNLYSGGETIRDSLNTIVDIDIREKLSRINDIIIDIDGLCVMALDGDKIVIGSRRGDEVSKGGPITFLIMRWRLINKNKARFKCTSIRKHDSPYRSNNVVSFYDCSCYCLEWASCDMRLNDVLDDLIHVLSLVLTPPQN